MVLGGLSVTEAMKLATSAEGKAMIATLKRIVEQDRIPLQQIMKEADAHMAKAEALAKRQGVTVKQVLDASLQMYEASITADGR
jgi:antitoxin component of RelBE/YafQ-DinJ toxin-antitoxin module